MVPRRAHSPPFKGGVAAPLMKKSRSLAAQTGWLVKGRVASLEFQAQHHLNGSRSRLRAGRAVLLRADQSEARIADIRVW